MTKSTKTLLPMRFDNKEINKRKPWSDDALERYKFADILTDKVKNGLSPYTISVSGGWGTGKTFMLQRWQQQLENDGYKAIYYNAWEDDFCVNPLVSIIGQIATKIEDKSFKSLIDSVKEMANTLLVKKTLGHVGLAQEDLQSKIDNTIDEYSEQIKQIEELKKSLIALTTRIEDNGHPLIFIIDELDRCRPTFAIEVLERIKHLFNIPSIIFVLGMNRIELEKSITHVYGDIGPKIILTLCDIDLTLSAPKSSNYYLHLINSNKHALSALTQDKNYEADLFDYLNISLRDTEYCFRVLCFILNTKISHGKRIEWVAACLIVILLRIENFELYWRFIQGKSSSIEIINYICGFTPESVNSITGSVDDIVIKEIYALANSVERDTIIREAVSYERSILKPVPNLAQRALPQISRLGTRYFSQPYEDNTLQEIASLLDLVEH
ncbi:MAG: KAP family P-loop NTPase fold protein [Gammaproteobacteria bacterium WSBS_2016_MAG_OTU1]